MTIAPKKMSESDSLAVSDPSSLAHLLRARAIAHLFFWLVCWPAFSVLMAAFNLREQSVTAGVPFYASLAGCAAGAVYMLPDIIACSLLLAIISVAAFSIVDSSPKRRALTYCIECATMLLALWLGFAFEFPSLLHHPLFTILRPLRVDVVYAIVLIGLLILNAAALSAKNTRCPYLSQTVLVLLFVVLGWAWTFMPVRGLGKHAGSNRAILLGLDSISLEENVSELRDLTRQHNGTFYEHAVTPGLLTNSVWQALMMHRMPSTTGVVLIYQSPDWSRSPYHLVREARRQGYETWAFFGDQFTCNTGSDGGFDHNESGPPGFWQLATSQVKDGSVLLPVLLSRMPRVPFARTPRNQAGTYAHDLRTEMQDMLVAGRGGPTLIAGHVDYLHLPAYPRMSEINSAQRSAVRHARLDAIRDLSLDWQYPEVSGDPIGLYSWKLTHLQQTLTEILETTGVLDPSKHNRLVVFSDHGNRKGLGRTDFGKTQYYNVLLATFGVPNEDPTKQLSLLDATSLLGFKDATHPDPMPPQVEYINLDGQEWFDAFHGAKFDARGSVIFPNRVIQKVQSELAGYRPYARPPDYYRAPVLSYKPEDGLPPQSRRN